MPPSSWRNGVPPTSSVPVPASTRKTTSLVNRRSVEPQPPERWPMRRRLSRGLGCAQQRQSIPPVPFSSANAMVGVPARGAHDAFFSVHSCSPCACLASPPFVHCGRIALMRCAHCGVWQKHSIFPSMKSMFS